jgi:predicted ATPase
LALWLLGQPDRALVTTRAGVAAGRVCGDAFSLALALCFSATLHRLRREPQAVREQAEEAIALSAAQDFPLWRGLGRVLRGWAVAHSGAGAEGLEEIRQGLAQLATIGTEVGATGCLVLLAEAAWVTGRRAEALGAVEAGLAVAELRQQHTSDGELHRLRGDLVLADEDGGGEEEAEGCFVRALETSRQQHATMFELRAAMSFGRLLRRRGRAAEARTLLDGVYRRFSEGFETPDLCDARALLAEL